MNGKILNTLLNMTLKPARAAALLLAVTAGLALSSLAISSPALAEAKAQDTPSSVVEGQLTSFKLAQQAPIVTADKAKKATKKPVDADSDEETEQMRKLLVEKTQWIREAPLVKTIMAVMPQMWTPIRLAAMLLFLVMFVGFHFRRQARNRLEFEQNREPTAVEREFRITANTDGKGASS